MKISKAHLVVRVAAVIITLVVGIIGINYYAGQIQVEQQKQVEQNLRDVAEQNEGRLQSLLDSRWMLLDAMCVQMSDEKNTNYLINQFAPLVDIYNVKRIGFANVKGMAYTTEHFSTDISDMESFQRSIRGETYLSDVVTDSVGTKAENVNVFSEPVYQVGTDRIMGVMFTTYRTEDFSDLLQVGSFGDQGTSCIFQEDGTIVVSTGDEMLNPGENLMDVVLEAKDSNRENIEELLESIDVGLDTITTFSDGNEDYFFFVSEVDGRPGWYMACVVPTSVMSQRTETVLSCVKNMVVLLVLLLVFCGLVYIWTSAEQNKQLYRLAYVDPLTGGDNYSAFRERMRSGNGASGAGYIVSVDLRGFGTINDTCGIVKGDEVIREMGGILASRVGNGELSAHVSGDGFVMFLHSESQEKLIERIAALRDEIANLSPLLDVPHIVPMFGIRAVENPSKPERGYGDANAAKQTVKEKGRTDYFYALFDAETHNRTLELQHLADSFENALEMHEFEMWYQPKYNPETGKLVAAEALVRWRSHDGSLIPPGKFIPLFEKNGMISDLDEYTFEAVCAQQRAWQQDGLQVVPVSVNVSRASLYYAEIVGRYMVIANRHSVTSNCIELEITESAMDGNVNFEELIQMFRSCGFHILMDDFGSGYSSLYTLTKKYFDNIKIDKSLTDTIGTEEGDSLLKSIIHLAHEFRMTVTAEGVEVASQVEFLRDLDCDNIQGYYYSRPLPADEFMALLAKA